MSFLTEKLARVRAEVYLQDWSEDDGLNIQEIVDKYDVLSDCTIHEGKVTTSIFGERLVDYDGIPLRIMIRTPRISTHDIGRGSIPFKAQVLALNHNFMRKLTQNIMPHAQQDVLMRPNALVTVSHNLEMVPVEFVMRQYNAYTTTDTSLYQHYQRGERVFCGHTLPDNLEPNAKLPDLIDTPSTKEAKDRSVSPQELFKEEACNEHYYAIMKWMGFKAFARVSEYLQSRNIILADTKLEFGVYPDSGEVVAIDELFTMDSSRFWPVENWKQALGKHEPVLSWSKEFARGFSKGSDQYTDEQRVEIAVRYMMGIQELTGQPFQPNPFSEEQQVRDAIAYILMYYNLL